MPRVKVGDINMYYEIHGKGEPLVLIQGLMGNTDLWWQEIPAFAKEYRVVAFDNKGAGQSDAPDIPYTMKMLADDLAGLLTAIGIESAHIYGHSMGGMIAQEFVLNYPQMVISLILGSTSSGILLSRPPDTGDSRNIMSPVPQSPEEHAREVVRSCVTPEFVKKNPEMIQVYMGQLLKHPAPPRGGVRQREAILNYGGTYERLPEIKAPTLLIHGDADQAVSVENSHILASRIPNTELVIIKGAGHVFLETKDKVNRTVLDFLRRHPFPFKETE